MSLTNNGGVFDERKQIIEDCPFVDPQMLSGTFYTGNYDVIFLSSLIESVYPIYKKKLENNRAEKNF